MNVVEQEAKYWRNVHTGTSTEMIAISYSIELRHRRVGNENIAAELV